MKAEKELVIKVIGVGGGGGNAVNRMVEAGIENVEFIALNTDTQDLLKSNAHVKIPIGRDITKGLGAGSDPQIGRKAAEESIEDIKNALDGASMIFITACEGGGTGTGASPIVAKLAHEMDILTIAVVSKPFSFLGKQQTMRAEQGISELKEHTDATIVVPSDNMVQRLGKGLNLLNALYYESNETLVNAVKAISDIISKPGSVINVDFADATAVLRNSQNAFIGIGHAKGENRIVQATEKAISSPLIEGGIKGASGAIINFVTGPDFSMDEFTNAMAIIERELDSESNVIQGFDVQDGLDDEVYVTVIASGFPPHNAGSDSFQTFMDNNTPSSSYISNNTSEKSASNSWQNNQSGSVANEVPISSDPGTNDVANPRVADIDISSVETMPNKSSDQANASGSNEFTANDLLNDDIDSDDEELGEIDLPDFLK